MSLRLTLRKFKSVRWSGQKYFVNPGLNEEYVKSMLNALSDVRVPLDIPEKSRSVSLLPSVKAVCKVNGIVGLRNKLRRQFGQQRARGKYGLADELGNLFFLEGSSIVPKVYAFSQAGFPVYKETLLLEFFENSKTLDELLSERCPYQRVGVLKQVFELFVKAQEYGFVHMDPHPKNIVFVDEGLKFIDFECCFIGEVDEAFYFGFSLGYLYHFWLSEFFKEEEYDALVYGFMGKVGETDFFDAYYKRFKSKKVSRTKRFKCFFEKEKRNYLLFDQA